MGIKKIKCQVLRPEYHDEEGAYIPPMYETVYFLHWGSQSSSVLHDNGHTVLMQSQTTAVIARIDGRVEQVAPEALVFEDINNE
jgi:hypothetical protein